MTRGRSPRAETGPRDRGSYVGRQAAVADPRTQAWNDDFPPSLPPVTPSSPPAPPAPYSPLRVERD